MPGNGRCEYVRADAGFRPYCRGHPAPAAPEVTAEVTQKTAPFSESDWTWLNSNGRVVDTPMATKYFTPEFRADVNYVFPFNHPKDDSLGGTTEEFRANEFQLEQLSFGGDFRLDNVRGRVLTMFGEFATTTPRNDASYSRGQWQFLPMPYRVCLWKHGADIDFDKAQRH